MRVPVELRERLANASARAGRSLNAEIVDRLERSVAASEPGSRRGESNETKACARGICRPCRARAGSRDGDRRRAAGHRCTAGRARKRGHGAGRACERGRGGVHAAGVPGRHDRGVRHGRRPRRVHRRDQAPVREEHETGELDPGRAERGAVSGHRVPELVPVRAERVPCLRPDDMDRAAPELLARRVPDVDHARGRRRLAHERRTRGVAEVDVSRRAARSSAARAYGSVAIKPGDPNTIYAATTTALRGHSSVCCSGVTRPGREPRSGACTSRPTAGRRGTSSTTARRTRRTARARSPSSATPRRARCAASGRSRSTRRTPRSSTPRRTRGASGGRTTAGRRGFRSSRRSTRP